MKIANRLIATVVVFLCLGMAFHALAVDNPRLEPIELAKYRAKMLALGCLMYSNDPNDTLPKQLSDIVPDYMTAEDFKIRSIDPLSQGGVTFLYLGVAVKDSVLFPLIVSQGKTPDGMTIVAYSNGAVYMEVYPKP